MTVEVRISEVGGCQVVAISGPAEPDLLRRLAEGIGAVSQDFGALVIDVDELMLSNVNVLRGFLVHLFDSTRAERIVFSCGRRIGRRMLRRWGGDELQVFDTLDASIAAANSVTAAAPYAPAVAGGVRSATGWRRRDCHRNSG